MYDYFAWAPALLEDHVPAATRTAPPPYSALSSVLWPRPHNCFLQSCDLIDGTPWRSIFIIYCLLPMCAVSGVFASYPHPGGQGLAEP